MELPFPEETVSDRVKAIQDYLDALKKRRMNSVRPLVERIFNTYSDDESFYGFSDHLRVGLYTPYAHEKYREHINTHNCTTVVPSIYIDMYLLGLNPQIVQFFDFKQIENKEDRDKPAEESHFAITLEMYGERYLFDPFWHVFGPIREQDEHHMLVGRQSHRKKVIREYGQLKSWSAEEFHAMMMDLRLPERSLEMLIAGQEIFQQKHCYECSTKMWVYYDDSLNRLTTRFYLDSNWLTDKVIFLHQDLDENGKARSKQFEFCYAKDYTWKNLVQPKVLARLGKSETQQLRALYRDILDDPKKPGKVKKQRFGKALADNSSLEEKTDLLNFAETLLSRLSPEEHQSVWPMVLARTIYESVFPQQDYFYSQSDRDGVIVEETELFERISTDYRYRDDQNFLDTIGALTLSPSLRRQNTLRKVQLTKEGEEAYRGRNFGWFRTTHRAHYDQVLDLVLFARKEASSLSLSQMEKKVQTEGLDPRVGYLAMVRDFLFFLTSQAQFMLELKEPMKDLNSRVKARRQYLLKERT